METEKLTTKKLPLARRRSLVIAMATSKLFSPPVLKGERLRKLQLSCPPKTYRCEATHA
jgi:hypothetical protein